MCDNTQSTNRSYYVTWLLKGLNEEDTLHSIANIRMSVVVRSQNKKIIDITW